MDLLQYYNSLPKDIISNDEVDEVKLTKLYVYNYEYGNNDSYISDLLDSITYSRNEKENNSYIDAIYIDQYTDETPIELLTTICFHNPKAFNLNDIFKRIDYISSTIANLNSHKYLDSNTIYNRIESLRGSKEYDNEINVFTIKVITDVDLPGDEKYYAKQKISNYCVNKNIIDVSIQFSSDIELTIRSNIEPFDFVNESSFNVDDSNNYLKYSNNCIVCNISAKSIKDNWEKYQNKLLAMNLRYYIKNDNIDQKIEDSIQKDPGNFYYYNNGMIIVCDDYELTNNKIKLKKFSIVNGGQTTRMIGEVPFTKDFYVVAKIIKNTYENEENKSEFIANIAEASNTQKPIKSKDVIANRKEQRMLQSLFNKNNMFIEIKRGDKPDATRIKEKYQKTKNNELAQDLYSFIYLQPGPAHNNVSRILEQKDKYNLIFVKNHYEFPLLKDIIYLEKAYKDYVIFKKKHSEDLKSNYPSIIKTGIFYFMSTIGLFLKLIYNEEYKNELYKKRNTTTHDLLLATKAFNNNFIKEETYQEFSKNMRNLFDFIFTNYISYSYDMMSENKVLAGSNFTKSSTGFLNYIVKQIEREIFDVKNYDNLNFVKSYFLDINEEQKNDNIDTFIDYYKTVINKDNDELDSVDQKKNQDLQNELFLYREKTSKEKHILSNSIFTNTQIEKLVNNKPADSYQLGKILSKEKCQLFGKEILEIISKYL